MKKKYQKIKSVFIGIAVVCLVYSCGPTNKKNKDNDLKASSEQSIIVFAGASLTDVLSEIIDSFEVKTNIEVKTNMASSGTLARQIAQGGSPDVYISASRKWANYVDSLGYILKDYKTDIAKNELALIAPLNSSLNVELIDSTLNFISLIGHERLSMGDPAHVPAGKYAEQSLKYFGWNKQLNNKILPAKDVRSALMVVEMGETPLGIVYKTDALKSEKVKILNYFPESSHKPIVFVAGVCKNNKAAKDFYAYLCSSEARTIWDKYGFEK